MREGERLLLSGMVWADGSPHLRARRNGKPSELIAVGDLHLCFDASTASRRCVGHKPFRDPHTQWADCDNSPLPQSRTCDRCTAVDATFASQLHHAHTLGTGEIDAAIRTHLDKPNVVYLAAFRDGSVKVGTSTAPRVETRLREQGAWTARVVANASNGFAVRVLEDAASTELGLSQSVTIKRKLDGLISPRPEEALDRELTSWVYGVHRILDELHDDRFTPTNEPWDNPLRRSGHWSGLHRYPHRLDRGAHEVALLDACGRAVRAQRSVGSDVFVADIGQLYGLELTLSSEVVPDELTVQDSLF